MRIFKTRWFARFARKEKIADFRLVEAVARAETGGIDATLGGGLIKQRVARDGGGKSGGFRTLIAFRASTRSVFLYGFAKSARENIEPAELEMLKKLALRFLAMTDRELDLARAEGEMVEVEHDDSGEEKIS